MFFLCLYTHDHSFFFIASPLGSRLLIQSSRRWLIFSFSPSFFFFFFFRKKYRTFETAWNIKLTLFCKYISILFKNFNLDLYSIVIKLNHTCLKEREPINRKDQIIANKLYLGYVFRNSGFGIFIKFSLTFSFLNHSKWRRALSFSTH